MTTTNNNISGRLKRVIKLISPLVVLFLVALYSCVDNKETYKPPTPPTEKNTDVFFEINVPQSKTPSVYALEAKDEDQINTVEILLFKINPDRSKTYTGKPYYCDNIETGTGASAGKRYFVVSLPAGGPFDIVMLANSRTVVDKLLVGSTPAVTEKDDLLKLFILEHDTKWVSTVGTNYVPIPMWGEMEDKTISENIKLKTGLMRMLAKIDVALSTPAAIASFKLQDVYLVNANTSGHIVPDRNNFVAGKIDVPTLVTNNPPPKLTFRYEASEATIAEKEFKSVIYTFEAEETDPSSLSTATCLVLKGVYSVDNKEYFYRVDFGKKESNGDIKYHDILRNLEYIVNINKISGPGYSSLLEAKTNPSSNIEADLVVWDNNEFPIVVYDGHNALGFSRDAVVAGYIESVGNPAYQIKVRTDHPNGWKVDKIVDASDVPIDWLTIPTTTSSGAKDTTVDVQLNFAVNNTGGERICYVQFSAGALKHVVVVKQLTYLRIDSVIWIDYVGTGLTSITIEDDLGGSYTSAVNALGLLVDGGGTEKPLAINGIISKVVATYRNYKLDVPVANYSYVSDTKIITIIDRSLIGIPKHLDLIREPTNLSGNYIQVDDIDLTTFTNWAPIGNAGAPFTGSYDGGDGHSGKGFTIKNLKINRPGEDEIGLFGRIASTAGAIKRIHIGEGSSIVGRMQVGGICGLNHATISTCSNSATVTGTSEVGGICGRNIGDKAKIINCANLLAGSVKGTTGNSISGICGINYATISTCSNSAEITGDGWYIGGICGQNQDGTVSGCVNETTGDVTGENHYVGGICGNNNKVNGNAVISNCENKAMIMGAGLYLGGISGGNNGLINDSCKNSGNIFGNRDYIGGICGMNSGTISDCENTADIIGDEAMVEGALKAAQNIGGVCGQNGLYSVVERSTNAGEVGGIVTNSNLGGICGFNYGKIHDNCINKGNINASEGINHIGGICGRNDGTSETLGVISNCTNEGQITTFGSLAGGIVGLNFRIINLTTPNISSCVNKGKIEAIEGRYGRAGQCIGGIVGKNENYGVVADCTNEIGGVVVGKSVYIGGICGWDINPGGRFKNCKNYARVTGNDDVGGICGASPAGLFEDCTNSGDISATKTVGGILGSSASDLIIDKCTNSGNISRVGTDYGSAGGICGSISRGIIRNLCSNTGNVTGSPDYIGDDEHIGGICGQSFEGKISESSNSGVISGINKGVGGIVGSNSGGGSITECHNLSTGDVVGLKWVGGVCGANQGGSITGCTNAAFIVAGDGVLGGNNVGGICGSNGIAADKPGGTISLCVNTGEVSSIGSKMHVGGICGLSYNSFIMDCSNNALVTGDVYVGGIVGEIVGTSGSSIYSCENLSNGHVSGYSNVGGISGSSVAGPILSSSNDAKITGDGTHIGGISGLASDITDSHNLSRGTVTGGGTLGGISGTHSGIVSNCSNEGVVTGTGAGVGGISGKPTGSITACRNNGAITSTGDNVGGIAGEGGTVSSSCNLSGGRVEGRSYVGGIGGFSGTYTACYNIASVTASTTNVGAIHGRPISMTDCYYGGNANFNSNTPGSITKFGAGTAWPNPLTMDGWKLSTATPPGPWENIGGWAAGAGGTILYPKLAPPP